MKSPPCKDERRQLMTKGKKTVTPAQIDSKLPNNIETKDDGDIIELRGEK